MNIFEVIDNDNNVLGSYATLIEAYASIDNVRKIISIKDYLSDLLNNIKTVGDFDEFAGSIRDIDDAVLFAGINHQIDDWYILVDPNQLEEAEKTNNYIINSVESIPMTNHILKNYGYTLTITRSKEYIKYILEESLSEDLEQLLNIAIYMIDEDLYNSEYKWQDRELDLSLIKTYDSKYNKNASYKAIKDGVAYSCTKAQLISTLIADMDNIIDCIINNLTTICNSGLMDKHLKNCIR